MRSELSTIDTPQLHLQATADDAGTRGVLLMTYGAAQSPEGVPAYLQSVYRRNAPQAVVEEFQRRYRLVGGSPLVEVTRAQATALEHLLNAEA
ncbi:MAG: ferrochelatase, partial [Chloroflexota bacterium]|nr:ferrochelatase [Chloroflexota bacterium]